MRKYTFTEKEKETLEKLAQFGAPTKEVSDVYKELLNLEDYN